MEVEQLLDNILQDCLLVFLFLFGLGCLIYYYLASPREQHRSRKGNNQVHSEAILHDFKRRYQQGKISKAQYEDILRRYSSK